MHKSIHFLFLMALFPQDLGAFIAGVAISAFFHHEKELEEKISRFGFGFLVPLFFIHMEASFDLHALLLEGVISGPLLMPY